jgi:hypothetical protein
MRINPLFASHLLRPASLQHPRTLLVNAYPQVYNYALFRPFRAQVVPEFVRNFPVQHLYKYLVNHTKQNGTLSEKSCDFVPVLHATPPFVQDIAPS